MSARGHAKKKPSSSSSSSGTPPWTPADAARALAKVKLTIVDETTVICRVGKNSLAEAVKGNVSRNGTAKEGKVIWANVLKRNGCKLPLPGCEPGKLEGSDHAADVFLPYDVPAAIHKLVGTKDEAAFFADDIFVASVKDLMRKCGLLDFARLDAVVEGVATRINEQREQLEIFRIPALRDEGAEFARMRLFKDDDGLTLISAHNQVD